MKISIIYTVTDFLLLKKDWDRLYAKKDYSVFQSFDFNYYSWENQLSNNKKHQLTIAVVKQDEGVIAIFPFYIDNKQQLRFINDIHADFCDCIAYDTVDFSLVLACLKNIFSILSVRLINLREDALMYTMFKKLNQEKVLVQSFEKYSVVLLGKGVFPDNNSNYKSKQKTEFRRVQKKNSNKTHQLLTADDFDFPRKDILLLKEKMLELGARKSNFLPLQQLLLIENLYNSKKIVISVVNSENKIHAISFILQKSNQFLFWIDMFDESKMVNIFNYISLIRKLSLQNSVIMNLGRGEYNYKIINFKPEIKQLYAVHIFTNKFQEFKFYAWNKVRNIIKPIYIKLNS